MLLAQLGVDPSFIQELAREFGPSFVLAMFALLIISPIWIRESKSRREKAAREEKDRELINQTFSDQYNQIKATQVRLDLTDEKLSKTELELVTSRHDRDSFKGLLEMSRAENSIATKNLTEAQAKITLLEKATDDLNDKVVQLEREKDTTTRELEREKLRNVKLEQELQTANANIIELRERMARYEGENTTMQAFIAKLTVIPVEQTEPPPIEDVA